MIRFSSDLWRRNYLMSTNASKTRLHIRALCEGAIMLALALVLNYLSKVVFANMPNGGSVSLAMFPILFYAHRWGVMRGLGIGFAYGLMDMLFDGGYAWGWQSILLDYLLAYSALGLGGCFRNLMKKKGPALVCGSLVALGGRYLAHILSGYILFAGWAEWFFTQEGFPGWGAQLVQTMAPNALGWLYSIVYNGLYMIPEMVITAMAALLMAKIPGVAEKIS
jgi:thiamine transporter